MKLLILLSLFTFNAQAAFIAMPETSKTVYGLPIMPKGALMSSSGISNGSSTICADTQILEWDSAEVDGVKCVAKPVVSGANYVVGGSSGLYFTTSTSYTLITNFSVTITTTGNPVRISVSPDGSASTSSRFFTAGVAFFEVRRDATAIATIPMDTNVPTNYGEINSLDIVGAGTYTYTVYVRAPSAVNFSANYLRLSAVEIK